VIWIYHDKIHHRGRPHFHATYSGEEASIDIETLQVIAGGLPLPNSRSSARRRQTPLSVGDLRD
jgi:hypothetical protein